MRKKFLLKLLSIFIAFIIGFSPLFTLVTPQTLAEDSPEEIARQEEEARREAERRAERAAREAKREAEEAAREAIEDITPTPIPLTPKPQPSPTEAATTSIDSESETSALNENTGNSNVSVDNNNSAAVNNNVTTTANTGNNVTSGSEPPTITPTPTPQKQQDPLPKCEDELTKSENVGGEEDNLLYESSEIITEEEQSSVNSESSSKSDSKDNDSVTVVNSNCAYIGNEQNIKAGSGDNDASNNEGSVMETGDSEANANLTNKGNENITSSNSNGNTKTASSEDKDSLSVENNNQIYVENEVNVESKSGGNSLNNNDGQAQLTTGDIDIMVTLLNILNLNLTGEEFTHLIVNIFGDLSGDVDLDKIAKNLGMTEKELMAIVRNENTQQEERAQKREEFRSRDSDVSNNNEATVRNDVNVSGISGQNELSGNEDRTKLLTGRIKILVALINFINTNYTGTDWYFAMVNIFGSLKGDLILPDPNGFLIDEASSGNSQSDSNPNGETEIENSQNINISNQNNVNLTNNIEVTGDSGSNQAYANEDRVSQQSGDVNVVTNLINWLNINIVGNNWVFLVINVFGKWYGQILGFPGLGTVEAPASGTLMLAAGGQQGNGPSVNESSTTDTTIENSENSAISNTNSATVENNVSVSGISGQNATNNNEDPVSVSTGWIDISANFLNIINMNVIGKHWMLVIVNIFGDFLGDITFPGVKNKAISEFKFEDEILLEESGTQNENQLGGISQNSVENQESIPAKIIVTVNPTPSVKIELIANNNQVTQEELIDKVEVYQALDLPSSSIENKNNSVKILGVSVQTSPAVSQTLFLIALLSYLIALRFWAFKRSS